MSFVSGSLKNSLNKIKNEIDKYPNWMFCVKNQFEYEKISQFDKTRRVSRAFYKLMEIFRTKNINKPQRALCLCEAPGGFIQAILEINPECFIRAQSIGGSIKFGQNLDSNLFEYNDLSKMETILKYSMYAKRNGKFDLVTGDGGIDVSDDYSNQESRNLRVVYCQILTMLYTLDRGGTFILKIFDMFHLETVQLLQVLYNHFEHFEIVKPVLSRPCNSEKYVICKKFRGYDKPLSGFSSQVSKGIIKFDNIDITPEFHSMIFRINNRFTNTQIRNIDEILSICRGKYNSRNINSRRTQMVKSMNMFHKIFS